MKLRLLFVCAALAGAQSITTTYNTDINGFRVPVITHGATDGTRTEKSESINGQKVPLEQSEEKILRDDSSGKSIERIVRKFDQTGRLTSTEKILVEERKTPTGSHTEQTTFRSDISGNLVKAEQTTSDSKISGNTTSTETVVSRPNINGGFETAEKRSSVTEKTGDKQETRESVQRRGDGGFYEALRQVTTSEKTGDSTKETTARYEPGLNGQLELASQDVSTSTKRPDGSEVTETNLYARSMYGIAQEQGAKQQIKEQQIVEKHKAADGSVVETLSVRRPTFSDPGKLGAPQQISQTVCTGKCGQP